MIEFSNILANHSKLSTRSEASTGRLAQIRAKALDPSYTALASKSVSVFAAGSLGRLEAGEKSDLDVFVISNERDSIQKLDEYQIFAALIDLNRQLNFEQFSRDGKFLKVHVVSDLTSETGKPQDDSENRFTTRMLLLLESHAITNDAVYSQAIETIASHYFRDSVGKKDFRPLFLLNDVLRFWRTLCLNYEEIRNDPERHWIKKNLNLKFSRKLTVFSTALSIVTGRVSGVSSLVKLSQETPLERLASTLDHLSDPELLSAFPSALDDYEFFLSAKEEGVIDDSSSDRSSRKLEHAATRFGEFLLSALESGRIDRKMRSYMLI